MAQYHVILVAGHAIGGDPGAVGQGTIEAVETVQIVDRVYDLLAPHPNVLVERVPHELDYVASTDWINKRYKWDNSDTIVVEVHLNAPAVASGTETFVGVGGLNYPETRRLAQTLQNGMVESIGLRNRGIKEGNFYLIQSCNPLAALLEVRFIGVDDNSDEADAKAAKGIANGICDFFRQPRPNTAPAPAPTPAPTPAPVVHYYVRLNGKQLGAYGVDKNAYNKWKQNPGSVILDGTGADITGKLVEKFEPPVVVPEPIEPVVDYGEENNRLLNELLALVKQIIDKLTKVFK